MPGVALKSYTSIVIKQLCTYQYKAREEGGGGIERAFDTIFRPLGWAVDDTGLPGGGGGQFDRCQARGRTVEFEPGNEMAMSLQDWNETSSLTRGSFERRFLCHDGCSDFGKW